MSSGNKSLFRYVICKYFHHSVDCLLTFFFFFLIYLFIYFYFWLCWVFVSARGLSLVVASGGHSSSRCAGFSPSRPLPLRSTGSRRAVIVAHRPSPSAACGIFPDQGSNPCPLHWQADSQPLRHQGSPLFSLYWWCPLKHKILSFENFSFCCLCFWDCI